MKIAIVYVFPALKAELYVPQARRFVETYMEHPPGVTDHELHVAVNGSTQIGDWCRKLFWPLAPEFLSHNNYGKDIGAYQTAADVINCDLLVCLGTPVHFHKPGWLDRIVMAYLENGPGVYSPWGFHQPRPHLRTTAFWLPPELLNSYPIRVSDKDRYQFEHGADSIALWSQKQGFEPRQVTWRGTYEMPSWHPVTRDESLLVDQHMLPR